MTNQIKINIIGDTGIGKSTVYELIADALVGAGLKIAEDQAEIKSHPVHFPHNVYERIRKIKDNDTVVSLEVFDTCKGK